ncbi:flagellar export chaperone FliS [Paracidovorax cattleyae]|uniref:Flagellar secretion chaperone FliS n=1 Tax=Paracidovorax cattleyae TaxID=80868 RepID=A0A1H0TR73_9BURK|nr:flagellar export chaperone FliS [Paracidovorax cattleyae]AVS76556.1 flagellar export chaperone FliS [Paracidovorax cattleyae]MBF9264649.1 flagellar export chaperone FliS [Paracidovorax cattleyae]SDP56128.1 flagellar protein FliS [Paracidovorax cattleyae]
MFTPVSSRAASVYRQVGVQSSVDGASPHQLIQMLFDGLMQSLNAARGSMQRGEVEEKGRHIGRAVRILEEGLKGGLNPAQGGEIASNLRSLYDYCVGRLTMANLRNDAALVEEVVTLIAPVAQGWSEIGAQAHRPS